MPRQPIKTGIPPAAAPIEWATSADGVLYTANVPIKPDGQMELGDIGAQAKVTFDNLLKAVSAAGGAMDDVTQVLIVLTKAEDYAEMNALYATYFKAPYPNRATILGGLLIPGMRIEVIAYAHILRAN